ncbi:MAG: FHA domain-containing protein, partial [Phycisphaerales bacterium]|nr:FHA domain-containing protein [Phycisphaerales bacterium]
MPVLSIADVNAVTAELVPGATIDIGRGEACECRLYDSSVSRRHARIQCGEGGGVTLVDLGSTHGTFVDDLRLQPNEVTLVDIGTLLRFGEVRGLIENDIAENRSIAPGGYWGIEATRPSMFSHLRSDDPEERSAHWGSFYSKYAPLIRIVSARRGMDDQSDIDDFCHDVIEHLIEQGNKVFSRYDNSRGPFRKYLAGVIRNRALTWHRAHVRRNRLFSTSGFEHPEAIAIDLDYAARELIIRPHLESV